MKKITSLVLAGSMILALCACAPKDQQETGSNNTTGQTEGSVTDVPSDASADAAATGDKWVDGNHFYVNGHEIVFEQSTVQDLSETGCYFMINSPQSAVSETKTYTLDSDLDPADMSSVGVTVCLYPDEASANSGTGCVRIHFRRGAAGETIKLKDCLIVGVSVETEAASAWGDKLRFDFPIPMTLDELQENSGEIQFYEEEDSIKQYMYQISLSSFWLFSFDENNNLVEVSRSGM